MILLIVNQWVSPRLDTNQSHDGSSRQERDGEGDGGGSREGGLRSLLQERSRVTMRKMQDGTGGDAERACGR